MDTKEKEHVAEEEINPVLLEAPTLALEAETPPEDLSLENLPAADDKRQEAISVRLATLSVREKIRYALFGTREIRAILIRDTNKEIARHALHSPKLTENEVESIAAMRGISDDVLREIGANRKWIQNYVVVHNLVRNPKTPSLISQRLLSRLRSKDLSLLTRDRSVSEAVRNNAMRLVKQRNFTGPGQ
jgi:hypothetical protein